MRNIDDVNIFLKNLFGLASQHGIQYVVIGGYKKEIDINASDIDILFNGFDEMRKFNTILDKQLNLSEVLRVVSKRIFSENVQWIISCNAFVFMLDLSVGISSFNIKQFDGSLFWEINSLGINLIPFANLVKRHSPQRTHIPEYIYVVKKKKITILHRWFFYIKKSWSSLKSLFYKRTGVFVVLYGCDGAGKSSVIREVKEDYFTGGRYIFPIKSFHWNPIKPHQLDKDLYQPQQINGKPYPYLVSMIKAIYLFFAFWIGYVFLFFRPLHRGFIVLGDRYFHDMLIHPERYLYNGPYWLVNALARYVPQPDISILLDAAPELLFSRKKEISFDEIKKLREKYLQLINKLQNAYIVDASKSLEATVEDVENIILEYLANRTAKKLNR